LPHIIKSVCKTNQREEERAAMPAIDDLNKLEEKVFQDYNQDGGLVTIAGLNILMAGMFIVIWSNATFLGGFIFLAVIAPVDWLGRFLWRRWITFPRLGYAKQLAYRDSPPNARRNRHFWLFILSYYPLYLSLSYSHPNPTTNMPESILVAGSLTTLGYMIGFKMYGIMAALLIGMIWLTVPIHIDPGWAVVVSGLIQMGIGLSWLQRFLAKQPRPEENHAQ
jgi:hypothetical protein